MQFHLRYIVYAGLGLLALGAYVQSGLASGLMVLGGALISVGIFKMIMKAAN